MNTPTKPTAPALSIKRRRAAAAALSARWGDKRQPSHTIRIDDAAYNALQLIPERQRRAIASRGVLSAANSYHGARGR